MNVEHKQRLRPDPIADGEVLQSGKEETKL
jgi:hypothetical protein